MLATSDLKRVRMAGRYFQRPENAISKSDEFIKVGKCTNMDAAFATDNANGTGIAGLRLFKLVS